VASYQPSYGVCLTVAQLGIPRLSLCCAHGSNKAKTLTWRTLSGKSTILTTTVYTRPKSENPTALPYEVPSMAMRSV
jgi:uncharacterized OB-fold protein